MRLLGSLIVWISLALGCVAASTAYSWSTDLADEDFILSTDGATGEARYAELAANAGGEPGKPPLARASTLDNPTPVTPELLAELREEGVERVRVKTFSVGHWREKWLFAGAVIGLLLGGWLVRLDTAKRLEAAERARAAGIAADGVLSPEEALKGIGDIARGLLERLPGMPTDGERMAAIVQELGEVQQLHVPAVLDGRAMLIARLGLGGYAGFMDRFAAMERQINRAWSASADGAYLESLAALERAPAALAEAMERLGRS